MRLPLKTRLHTRLRRSLSGSFIRERARARGVAMPATNAELRHLIDEMKGKTRRVSDDARVNTAVGLHQNWPIFDLMNTFLQV